ncbi:hypothetical protein H8B15_12010 [Hymenobacter sp. BT507]|uniref:Exostosin GT47 domain-containing protein n=1 Tax=Hymenobacter citatus TaxID=2763506 RepID=A0ABR7MLA1_9BACT|nr:hypothetical protein [Hymenobacter citatus]MBC6611654.1 hypothetical protein [Hymenobacter citatus]
MKNKVQEIKGNYPVEEIYSFRESGYIKEVATNLSARLSADVELYLYFQLSKWKGNDLVIASNGKKKVVLCVGDESPNVSYPFLAEVDSVFRTYLPGQLHGHGKLNHLAVGPSTQFVAAEVKDFEARQYNVFFSGNLHLGRADLYRALTGAYLVPFALLHRTKKLLGTNFDATFPSSVIRFSTGFHNGISPSEYANYMQDSKICLCPAGVENPETMRHFEAAQLGNIVVTLPLPNVPVYKEAPFVVLSSWRELHKTIRQLLAEPNYMLDLHRKTLEWWRRQAAPETVASLIEQRLHEHGL